MVKDDPEAELRRRLMAQPLDDPAAPVAPAPFDGAMLNTRGDRDADRPPVEPAEPAPAPAAPYVPPDPPPFLPVDPPPATTAAPPNPITPAVQPERVNAAATPPSPAPVYAPVQGFDATKMADANYSSAKYTPAARAFSAGQGAGVQVARNNLQPMVDYAKANGFANARVVGDDRIDFGDGNGPIDVVMSNGQIWFQNGQDRAGGTGTAGTGANLTGARTNTAGAGAGGAGGAGGTGGAGGGTDFMQQVRALLMAQIAKADTPVDENAQEIAAPLSAARDEVSRASDAERKAQAEHLYATGDLHSSTLGQTMQQSAERQGTALSQLRAGLISKEYTQKRDELQGYMQLAVASGDAEMAREVQLEITRLNNAVQREGLGINWAEFIAGLNQNAALAGLRG